MEREITYGEAIREALDQSLEKDPSVFIIGEGVPDPKRIFGTTSGLVEKYGKTRVLDMPVSENGLTGICIGASLNGLRPIMVHQRVDFVLLALDQIINNAAKWHYMFGGKSNIPIVIRLIIGMGWGQGAQHSQNLHAFFAHTPGLKVVVPATPYDAKGLLISSVEDNNPVIFIEHRWLHYINGHVPEEYYKVPIGKGKIILKGDDITIAATSYMTIESLKAAKFLASADISAEVVDIRTLKPFDENIVVKSVDKTGHLLVADSGYYTCGFASEVIARISEKKSLKSLPQRITLPDIPTPTSHWLTKNYYPSYKDIIIKVLKMLGKSEEQLKEVISNIGKDLIPSDIPDKNFTGPF